MSGDYRIVNAEGWEWTGRDAELRLTNETPSAGRKQNWIAVVAIGPMHERSSVVAPGGTRTIKERDIADKPVPPGMFVSVSFDINSSTYLSMSGSGVN